MAIFPSFSTGFVHDLFSGRLASLSVNCVGSSSTFFSTIESDHMACLASNTSFHAVSGTLLSTPKTDVLLPESSSGHGIGIVQVQRKVQATFWTTLAVLGMIKDAVPAEGM